MIVLKRRNVQSDGSIRAKWQPFKSSVICSKHFRPNDLARSLDFQREEGILLTPWLKRDEFGITAFPSIHAAVVAYDLRRKGMVKYFFWANILCLDMLVSFLVRFFEKKSVRVIWARLKSFQSHVNKHTSLEDQPFNKCGHGDIQARIGLELVYMLRTLLAQWRNHKKVTVVFEDY